LLRLFSPKELVFHCMSSEGLRQLLLLLLLLRIWSQAVCGERRWRSCEDQYNNIQLQLELSANRSQLVKYQSLRIPIEMCL